MAWECLTYIFNMLLFLDFDGVLHPLNRSEGTFVHIESFESVLRDFPSIDIVISSSWRESHDLKELRALFSEDIAQRIVDSTPVFSHLDHQHLREAEIIFWLRDCGREYEEWIALDDSEWLFSPRCPRLILVDSDVGFNDVIGEKLRKRLAGR